MISRTAILVVLMLQIAAAGPPSSSTPKIPKASMIEIFLRPGEQISLVTGDQRSIKGQYMYISRLDSALFLAVNRAAMTTDTSVQLRHIQTIRYQRAGRPQLAYAVGGLVLGTLLGHFAERVIFDPGASPGMFDELTQRGSFYGGMSGLVLGTVISMAIPSSRIIDCSGR